MRSWWIAIALAGCSEYGVQGKPDEPGPPLDTGSPPLTVPTTPVTTPASCATSEVPSLAWVGDAPFTAVDDPVDAAGLPFWDPASDRSGWTAVPIPDVTIPVGQDRAYAATFTLAELPYDLALDLESDDGIEVWLNGVEVGRWGGGWQMEGCVNEHAKCIVTADVPPVDVTSLLQLGENVLAARVSNPVLNSWFEIVPLCVD